MAAAVAGAIVLGAGPAQAAPLASRNFYGYDASLSNARGQAYSAIIDYQRRWGNCEDVSATERYRSDRSGRYFWEVVVTGRCPVAIG